MTIKEMKDIIENVDRDHGWKLDHSDGYSGREFWFYNFGHATVIAERESFWQYWEGCLRWDVMHYYFFKEGDTTLDRPLSNFRETKTSVLNKLKDTERRK